MACLHFLGDRHKRITPHWTSFTFTSCSGKQQPSVVYWKITGQRNGDRLHISLQSLTRLKQLAFKQQQQYIYSIRIDVGSRFLCESLDFFLQNCVCWLPDFFYQTYTFVSLLAVNSCQITGGGNKHYSLLWVSFERIPVVLSLPHCCRLDFILKSIVLQNTMNFSVDIDWENTLPTFGIWLYCITPPFFLPTLLTLAVLASSEFQIVYKIAG